MAEITFSEEEYRFIKNKYKLTDDQLEVFLQAAARYGLNPVANQIYPQVRGQNMTMTTGIDGFRLMAQRTGCYAGNDDPIYDDEEAPRKATVTVWKIVHGARCPFTASARWDQYFPGERQGFMWKKMPHLMLGKCAESLALRKAFPAELSGLYTQEEMQQAKPADNDVVIEVEAPTPQRAVPEEAAEETDKEAFTRLVRQFSGAKLPKDVFANCKEVLSHLNIPIDGSAGDEEFTQARAFVEDAFNNKFDSWLEFREQTLVDAANDAAGSDIWE